MSDVPAHLVPASGKWTVYFERESIRLGTDSKETLDALGKVLQGDSYLWARIVGHASPAEPRERQQALSDERAEVTMAYLVTHQHIKPTRMESVGRGAEGATGDAELDRRAVVTVFDDGSLPAR